MIVVGIESHVCVLQVNDMIHSRNDLRSSLQTALDLLEKGIAVHVVADAVSSRSLVDRRVSCPFPLLT